MNTPHTFRGHWFAVAIIIGIVIAECIASLLSHNFALHLNRLTVAFAGAGAVGMLASIICKDWRAE